MKRVRFVGSAKDDLSAFPNDARSRKLRLSTAGKRLVRRLESLWETLNATSVELNEEAGHVIDALDRLDQAESALYADLQANAYARSVRLEQERVSFAVIEKAVADC